MFLLGSFMVIGFVAENNAEDFISSGGVKELIRISVESSREDIRNLAQKTLRLSPAFRTMQAQQYTHNHGL